MSPPHLTSAVVSVPYYEGFDQFAIWPSQQNVSFYLFIEASLSLYIILVFSSISCWSNTCIFQAQGSYDLISNEAITNPVATGHFVHLPYYVNCNYVAFKAANFENVSIFSWIYTCSKCFTCLQIGRVDILTEQPETLKNYVYVYPAAKFQVWLTLLLAPD